MGMAINGVVLFAKAGIPQILRTGVQNVQVVGREKVKNRDTVHLSGRVSGEKLNPLIGPTLKPDMMYPVDLWIDGKSADHAQLHVVESGANGWFIELFGENEPVDIPTPQLPAPQAAKPQA